MNGSMRTKRVVSERYSTGRFDGYVPRHPDLKLARLVRLVRLVRLGQMMQMVEPENWLMVVGAEAAVKRQHGGCYQAGRHTGGGVAMKSLSPAEDVTLETGSCFCQYLK